MPVLLLMRLGSGSFIGAATAATLGLLLVAHAFGLTSLPTTGRRLFAERRLSEDGTIACIDCLDLTAGGVDGRPATSIKDAIASSTRSNAYRFGLIFLSGALIAAVAIALLRLRRNTIALNQALASLELEKRVVELAGLNQHLEARVEERTHELSASREEYRGLLETTNAVPWCMAPGVLRFAYVGPQGARLIGSTVEEWMRDGLLRERLHPDDLESAVESLEALSFEGAQSEFEVRMVATDGRDVWLRTIVSTTMDVDGRPIRRGIFLDVTARRRLEEDLRASQKLESLGRLSAGIAHEINTPIQFVGDSVYFVKQAFDDIALLLPAYRRAVCEENTAEERVSLAAAVRQADVDGDTDYALENVPKSIASATEGLERIATIVKSLKDFSHPDRIEKTAVDINSNIRSTLTIASNEYKHVADLETDLGQIPAVICHGGEINQVVLNLIVNAAHAISDVVAKSHGRGRIRVRTWQEQSTVCICVRDSGAGIPSQIRQKIFDPFFTTKEVGRGTGQGLALARRIVVDKHGGELTFETEVGMGTAFVIRLPISGHPSRVAAAA